MSSVDVGSDSPVNQAVAALERAVYLLDRDLAPGAKVKAFARAAEIVATLTSEELHHRAESGTLLELAGIGPSTGGVIADVLAGRPSPYLERLERETVVALGEGAELRARLQGDCHSHSTWSDGGATMAAMGRAARALGHAYLVVTDHSPRMAVARGLTGERLATQRAEIDALNEAFAAEAAAGAVSPFRLLQGLEVDINEDGSLDMDDATLAGLDLVVASPHVKLKMDRKAMTRRLVLAAVHPHVDVLGHCTGRKVAPHGNRAGADFDADMVFAACAQHHTAVEINCRPERQDPPEELLTLALEWETKVAINTDAHAPGQLEWQNYGCDKAALAGIEPDEVINTWPLERLLAWGRPG
ncbi:MAG: PHP domain-containing protein [Acidimicrobiales bacterium]